MSVGLYRFRRHAVQAVQFTGTNGLACAEIAPTWTVFGPHRFVFRREGGQDVVVRPGDWIVRAGGGVVFVVPEDYFEGICEPEFVGS